MAKKTYDEYPIVYVKFKDHFSSGYGPIFKISEIKKMKPLYLEVFGALVFDKDGYIVVSSTLTTGYEKDGREQDENHEPHAIIKSTIVEFKQFSGPKYELKK